MIKILIAEINRLLNKRHCINSQTSPDRQKEDNSVYQEVIMTLEDVGYSLRCIDIRVKNCRDVARNISTRILGTAYLNSVDV